MTASLSPSHHDHTFADYLALERDSEVKHEFDAGEIVARSGGTARHSALAAKIVTAMETTRAPGCTVFTSDMRVRVAATGRATYPDVSMVCGPIEYDPASIDDDPIHTGETRVPCKQGRATTKRRTTFMRNSGKAPTMVVWVISLVLFLIALAAHFGVAKIGQPIASWSWIGGYALLLIACQVKGL